MGTDDKLYFPMFVDLSDKKVVVIGAGTIAKRRIREMVHFTRHLVVIAPEINPELRAMEEAGAITVLRKEYEREDIYDAALVISAAGDNRINQEVYAHCRCLGIPVNVFTDKKKCDFFFPALAYSQNLVAGLSASGRQGKKTKEVLGGIQNLLENR